MLDGALPIYRHAPTQINNHFNDSEKNTGTTKQTIEPAETDTITDIYWIPEICKALFWAFYRYLYAFAIIHNV